MKNIFLILPFYILMSSVCIAQNNPFSFMVMDGSMLTDTEGKLITFNLDKRKTTSDTMTSNLIFFLADSMKEKDVLNKTFFGLQSYDEKNFICITPGIDCIAIYNTDVNIILLGTKHPGTGYTWKGWASRADSTGTCKLNLITPKVIFAQQSYVDKKPRIIAATAYGRFEIVTDDIEASDFVAY